MAITPYRNRHIDPNTVVKVYRNIHRKGHVYSIQQNNLVVGHATDITLVKAYSKINASGQKRAVEEKTRNVHAFIMGFFSETPVECTQPLTYNPFKNKTFVNKNTGLDVTEFSVIRLQNTGAFYE